NPLSYNGAPALSVPSGFSQAGLPLSLQLVGKQLQEALLCQVGYRYEQATPWHKKRRPMKSA
ncbi:MAG TPA: Asp-tRNA(Asn)/Glu-tRNA(Gln) amidotransferase GatCAB subunit A, partial [Planctomycetaceae bacterium]|nr:Asp-tRNA(Asn)/Glu-tRNA(Gln) amidotransferase GatCAB subunit A [Planctomycetaceae bacterium]